MSFFESDENNETYWDKYILLFPKKRINRSICNNKGKSVYYANNNDIETDISDKYSLTSKESEINEYSEHISTIDDLLKNTSKYKNLPLKIIPNEINLSINKEKNNNSKILKEKNVESYCQNNMEISDEENIEINSRNEMNKQFLPCRQEEQMEIYNFIKNGLKTSGNYNSLYICGTTGTGKTESVKRVIKIIEEENKEKICKPFRSLFINCVDFDTDMKLIKCIYNFIFVKKAQKLKVSRYLGVLDEFFSERNDFSYSRYLNDPTNSHIILIIDEIDYLINKHQIMLYHIFNWSSHPNSKLIIISISNLINIKDLFLSRIASRFGYNQLMFKPYTKEQIREIINYKGINLKLFDEDALKLISMKVSAITGDLRRVIIILKRALELYNENIINNYENDKKTLINKHFILKAYSDLFDSKIILTLKQLKICHKIIIGSILFNINKYNNNSIKVENVYDTMNILLKEYNDYNMYNGKIEFDINWYEFKNMIYDLNRIRIIKLSMGDFNNLKDNFVFIKFYPDEFFVSCEFDDDFKPINIFLKNSLN